MKNFAKIMGAAALCTMIGVSVARAETVVLQDSDRDVIREYVYESHGGCPAGTVMTEKQRWFGLVHPQHNCVIPKGATVTFYQPGTVIPDTVTYTQLPTTVTTQLPAAPAGAVYVTSGNGVYLIDPTTRRVVDTINIY
jgi:hypothetical protein